MASTVFSPGTPIVSTWLNDVNNFVYGQNQYNVVNYGAKNDADFNGTGTPNADAFQACIDAAWAALQTTNPNDYSGVVIVPAGNWLLEKKVTIYPGIHLKGAGMYTTKLIIPSSATGNILFPDATNPPYSNVAGFPTTITDMAVLAQTGGAPSANGIYVNKNGVFLNRVWVNGFYNNIVLNNTDILLSDFVSELGSYGVVCLQPNCTVTQGVLHSNTYGVLVQNIITATALAGTSTTIQFPTTTTTPSGQPFTTTNNAFNGWLVTIRSGTGAGQQRMITAYTGATRTATVSPAWSVTPDSTSVFDVDVDNGSIVLSDLRFEPCTQNGLLVSYARRVQGSNLGLSQINASNFVGGSIKIENSVDIELNNVATRSALYAGAINTIADGIVVNNSAFVSINGSFVAFWRNGILVNGGQNISINNIQSTSNYVRGALLQNGDQISINGGMYSNNGSSGGANDCGIESVNTQANATHTIYSAQVIGLGGIQDTGIICSLTDNGSNTGQTVIGGDTISLYNNTASYSFSGRVDRIFTSTTIPASRNLQTVASAATITLPPSAAGRSVLISGTTNITSITAAGFAGLTYTLIFQNSLTVSDAGNLKLAANFNATADDTLTITCDGTNWYQVSGSPN